MASRKVLLVGWDAADWKVIHPLVESGKMPHVRGLLEHGASGPVATLHPPLSPMLWTSIATAKRPFKHGILGFAEPGDDGCGVQPITNRSRKCKALWNILGQNDLRSVVVGWWPSHPAEPINGVMVSDRYLRAHAPLQQGWPLAAGAVHPPDLAPQLADLRVHPEHLTPELVERFVLRARQIDQDQDKRLAGLLKTLAECLSIQSAAAWLIDHQPWDLFAVYFEAIDHFSHGFMRYHPPRQAWIGERDFDLYRNVVSMAYQLHDQMLGVLLEKAGGDVTVILTSDHGFHPDHLRPMSIPDIPAGPAVEHRDFGIFAMQGPGICKKTALEGASILDVTPTILALFGLPVGEDMDGQVLSKAFAEPVQTCFIPSWEKIAGNDGRHPADAAVDAVATREMLEQMIALGYLERPAENRNVAAERSIRELRCNLACAYQDAGRHRDALEILTLLQQADPLEVRLASWRFASCQALGMLDEMRRIIEDLRRQFRPGQESSLIGYLTAQVCIAERRESDALALLEQVAGRHAASPGILSQMGDLYFNLRRLRQAGQSYGKALRLDPDHVGAYLGLSRLTLRNRKFRVAAEAALNALRQSHHPLAHFLLGCALTGMRDYERAADAFRRAISLNPNFPDAHRRLAKLLEGHLGDVESALEHRRLARLMTASRQVRSSEISAPKMAPEVLTSRRAISPLREGMIVVTGLPRSGTSMIMQMLFAGGVPILADGLRDPDDDNPRGYFEFEPIRNILTDSSALLEARGKAVKITAPLLSALPRAIPCKVIFCERDLTEILDSQDSMLRRRGRMALSAARRQILVEEYTRVLDREKTILRNRPATELLLIEHREAICNPRLVAERISKFLGGKMDIASMASIVDPALYRNRHPRPDPLCVGGKAPCR